MAEQRLVQRSDKVAYWGTGGGTSITNYDRMTGFTDFAASKNPKEYTRQYVDEQFEQTDVTGYSPEISYAFDEYAGNAVHQDIVSVTDSEKTGTDMVRSVVQVLFHKPVDGKENTYEATKRDFTIVPDAEADGTDAYTYSGVLRSKSAIIFGEAAVTAADRLSCTFTVATPAQQSAQSIPANDDGLSGEDLI